jgi:hypothetical protein
VILRILYWLGCKYDVAGIFNLADNCSRGLLSNLFTFLCWVFLSLNFLIVIPVSFSSGK